MSTISNIAGKVVWPVVNAVSAVGSFYTEMNPSTLSGAIDIIVVEQEDSTLQCSPFHVRFGKLKILNPSDKLVDISVNGIPTDLKMKMGEAGECFFVIESENPVPSEYATSPLPAPAKVDADIDQLELPEVELKNSTLNDDFADDAAQDLKLNDSIDHVFQMDPLEPIANVNVTDSKTDTHSSPKIEIHSFDEKKHNVAKLSSSPQYVWSWGGFPEKQQNQLNTKRSFEIDKSADRKISTRASTSLLNERANSKELLKSAIHGQSPQPEESIPDLAPIQIQLDDLEISEGAALVEISICGPLKDMIDLSPKEASLKFQKHIVSFELLNQDPGLLSDPLTIYKFDGHYHSWVTAAPSILSRVAFGKSLGVEGMSKLIYPPPERSNRYGFMSNWFRTSSPPPFNSASPPKPTALARSLSPSRPISPPPVQKIGKSKYSKSLRLNDAQLRNLNLKRGVNQITFTITSSLQGVQTCSAKIFFWDYKTKIVISDVDGTITKSDVLGHVFTMVGKDWTHEGVANLYTNIHSNGYQFLYLTSRAIGQASYTREYLAKVEQGEHQLPEGPLLLSPDRLMRALTREVILRKPEEFKIACLRDIKRLFGKENPFYAGFGNRITDALSYRSVEIPPSHIFTVDPSGELKLDLIANFKSSYIKLNETVNEVFPCIEIQVGEFNDFAFWTPQHVDITIPGDEFEDSDSNSEDDIEKIKDIPY